MNHHNTTPKEKKCSVLGESTTQSCVSTQMRGTSISFSLTEPFPLRFPISYGFSVCIFLAMLKTLSPYEGPRDKVMASGAGCLAWPCLALLGPNCMPEEQGCRACMGHPHPEGFEALCLMCLHASSADGWRVWRGEQAPSLHLMASVNIPLKSLCRASLHRLPAILHSPFTTQPPDLAKNMSLRGQGLGLEQMLEPGIRGGWPEG